MLAVGRPAVEATSTEMSPASVAISSPIRSGVVMEALARDCRAGLPAMRRLSEGEDERLALASPSKANERELTHALRVDEGINGGRDGGSKTGGMPSDVVGKGRDEEGECRGVGVGFRGEPRVVESLLWSPKVSNEREKQERVDALMVIRLLGSARRSLLMKSMAAKERRRSAPHSPDFPRERS